MRRSPHTQKRDVQCVRGASESGRAPVIPLGVRLGLRASFTYSEEVGSYPALGPGTGP